MNQYTVLYEGWQMQCCGAPFDVGDKIQWLVFKVDEDEIKLPVYGEKIDYCYEAHSSDYSKLLMLSGVVKNIRALYCKYEPSAKNPQYLIPVSGFTVIKTHADGWEKPIANSKFSDYIIDLIDIKIRAAKQSEVTFK